MKIHKCKICGKNAVVKKERLGVDYIYKVSCSNCSLKTRGYFELYPAIDSWNGGTNCTLSKESNGWLKSVKRKKKTTGSR